MRGSWKLTWHEDGRVNPGVPDLSFVMNGGHYETGWIELKAVTSAKSPIKWKMEQSQHEWIRSHIDVIPIFILAAAGETCWLFNGVHHGEFHIAFDEAKANEICLCSAPFDSIRSTLAPILRNLTDRRRFWDSKNTTINVQQS